MRYRPLSATGDYTIGVPFLYNTSACVAQAIQTRLQLWLNTWFMNLADGTDWLSVLGPRAGKNPDAVIKARILGTPGVEQMLSYSSSYNGLSRTYTVTTTVLTIYSAQPVTVTQTVSVP